MIEQIDHFIMIDGQNVSPHVISFSVQQSTENESDPGKIQVVLANVDQAYTTAFTPQVSQLLIVCSDFETSNGYRLVAIGKVTDTVCPIGDEVTVKGECDLGHLADCLPNDKEITAENGGGSCKEIIRKVLDTHDTYINLKFECEDKYVSEVTYEGDTTYQAVLDDMRVRLGAVFYFDETNTLVFRDPRVITNYINLDKYCSQPTQAKSIMGYCNAVTVSAYDSLIDTEWDGWKGHQTPKHLCISAQAPSLDGGVTLDTADEDIVKYGKIVSKKIDAYNVHNMEEAFDMAEKYLEFYKQKKDTLTEVVVEGIVPPLQSLVSYTAFQPPESNEEPTLLLGVVIEKKVEYSSEGLTTTISLHPRDNIQDVLDDLGIVEEEISNSPNSEPMTDSNGNLLSGITDKLNDMKDDFVTEYDPSQPSFPG
jgi:hypothetical protein